MAPDQWFGVLTGCRSRSTPKLRQPAAPAPMPGKADASSCGVISLSSSQFSAYPKLIMFACAFAAARDSAVNSYRDRAIDFVTRAFGWAPGAAARAMRQSFVHDALDRASAAPALHVAAKAAIDFVRGQRLRSRSSYQVAYRLVAKHVA